MARIRTIKPEFFDDEEIAALSFPARLAFIGLWQQADREGRLKDRPVRLKARIFPFDDLDMVTLLDELERRQFIQRYTVGGEACIHVRTFEKHQHVNQREPESSLPAPDEHDLARAEQVLARVEGKGREGNRKGMEDSAALPSSTTPAALTFPVVGRGPNTWGLTDGLVADWQAAFLGISVLGECRKALAWVQARPERRKTARGMPAFLVGWLNRATDSGRGLRPAAASSAPVATEWNCPHLEPCTNRGMCRNATILGRPVRSDAVAS